MIQLTRLRHGEPFFLNPDLFERVDSHVDTVVRLQDGTEYVVREPGDEIVRRIVAFRAEVIALAARMAGRPDDTPALEPAAESRPGHDAAEGWQP